MKYSLRSLSRLTCFIVLCFFTFSSFSQEYYVGSANLSSSTGNEGKTYNYTGTVTLTNGFVADGTNGSFTITPIPINPPPSPNENYVRVEVPKVPVGDEEALTLMGPDDKSVSYSYSDGLGRTLMTTASAASPDYEDYVQPSYYDPTTGRMDKAYMSFTKSNNNGAFINNSHLSSESYYANPPSAIASDSRAYSSVSFEDSPFSSIESIQGVGSGWNLATPKDFESDYFLNDSSNPIIRWIIDSNGNPIQSTSNSGKHNDYTLQIVETENEDGIKTQSITDSRGRNIVTRTWYDDDNNPRWITTHYVYDAFNRLRFILPPAIATKATITSSELSNFAFEYQYDFRGRITYEKNPGIDEVLYVYDNRNRLVYSQDGVQRNDDQWIFRKYDRYNRLIMTGIYTSISSQSSLQIQLQNASESEMYEIEDNSAEGYSTTQSFPKNSIDLQTITYYDNYNFRNNTDWDTDIDIFQYGGINPFIYNSASGIASGSPNQYNVKGLTTGSKVKKVGTSKWLNTVIYYDDEYRVIQIVSENHRGSIDRISNQLDDYTGILKKMKLEHEVEIVGGPISVLSEYEYDHEFRLLKTYQQINNDPKVLVADYQYNALGQLIEKNLHSTDDGDSFLQSVDYRYNIRGWLSNINNDQLSEVESKANEDLFGANYHYESTPTINGVSSSRYDGSLSSITWKAENLQGDVFKRTALGYTYDDLGRLDDTNYATGNGSSFSDNANDFDVDIAYNDQGNITFLTRQAGPGSGNQIDDLTYEYNNGTKESNKLWRVSDTKGTEGFNNTSRVDGTPINMTFEYEYDGNGNLKFDHHKEMQIDYNYLQLPELITFGDGSTIEYTYDATGNRLSKEVNFADGETEKVDYIGLIEYRNNKVYQIYMDEGRAFKQNDQFFYEYMITDHQGNNRVSFGILPERNVYKANMEEGAADNEFAFPTSDPRLNGENKTTGGYKSAHLNHSDNRSLGPAKVLNIKDTDVVEIEFWAKYESATSTTGTFGDLVATLLTTYGVNATDGASGEALSNTIGSGGTNPFVPSSTTNPDDAPDAYLAYLFFDANYNFKSNKSSFVKVGTQSLDSYAKYSIPAKTFDEDGYLFIYLANETQEDQEVFFDDLEIVHESPAASFKVSQINEYYPFGMLTKNSWRNSDFEDPGMGYQSYYSTYDSLTEYNDFFLRNYEPALGRWMQNDPYSQFASPYVAMGNNPHMSIDPDGGTSWLTSFLGGAALGGAIGGISAELKGNNFWDGFTVGAIGGGAAGLALGQIYGLAGINSTSYELVSSSFYFAASSISISALRGKNLNFLAKSGLSSAISGFAGSWLYEITDNEVLGTGSSGLLNGLSLRYIEAKELGYDNKKALKTSLIGGLDSSIASLYSVGLAQMDAGIGFNYIQAANGALTSIPRLGINTLSNLSLAIPIFWSFAAPLGIASKFDIDPSLFAIYGILQLPETWNDWANLRDRLIDSIDYYPGSSRSRYPRMPEFPFSVPKLYPSSN